MVDMPEMDGCQTTRYIRRCDAPTRGFRILDSNRNVPIIVITSHNLDSERAKYLSLGVNEVLHKPVRGPELLISVVKKFINRNKI